MCLSSRIPAFNSYTTYTSITNYNTGILASFLLPATTRHQFRVKRRHPTKALHTTCKFPHASGVCTKRRAVSPTSACPYHMTCPCDLLQRRSIKEANKKKIGTWTNPRSLKVPSCHPLVLTFELSPLPQTRRSATTAGPRDLINGSFGGEL